MRHYCGQTLIHATLLWPDFNCTITGFALISTQKKLKFKVLYYRRPTKLWESNAFTRVRLSTGGRREGCPHVTITHGALDLTVQPPPPDIRHWGPPSSPTLQTSDIGDLPSSDPPPMVLTSGGD